MDDSETLHLIEDAGRAFCARWGGASRARAYQSAPLQRDSEVWSAVVEQGWIGLMVPEAKGGLGLSARTLVALALELGRNLVSAPILSAIAASRMLAQIGTAAADALLAKNLSGEELWLGSLPSHGAPLDLPRGKKAVVSGWLHDSHEADGVMVFDLGGMRAGGLPLSSIGTEVFRPTIDGGSIGAIALDAIPDEYLLAAGADLLPMVLELRDVLAIGTAAMLIGCAKSALDMSLEYLKTRKQFGVPIGSFQALQHRAASLHVGITSTATFLSEAASCFESANRTAACAAVRARAADCALDIVKDAVQFHGAIGFADEHDLGLHFRRVVALSAWHGNGAHWRRIFFDTAMQKLYASAS